STAVGEMWSTPSPERGSAAPLPCPPPVLVPPLRLPRPLALAVPPASALAEAFASPSAVPDYEILGKLGRGGMGIVYKARHRTLDRIVALKTLRTDKGAGPEELAHFRREAEAIAQLQHPNVVQIYEIGEHEGQPFLALEFADG